MLVGTFNNNYSGKINIYPSYRGYKNSTNALNKGVAGDVFVKSSSVSFTGLFGKSVNEKFFEELNKDKPDEEKLIQLIRNPQFSIDFQKEHIGIVQSVVHKNLPKFLKVLLERKDVDPNFEHTDWSVSTYPILLAINHNYIECLETLLADPQVNVNVKTTGYGQQAPIHHATHIQYATPYNTNCLKALLKHPNINVDITDADGETALQSAIQHNNLDAVMLIKEYKKAHDEKVLKTTFEKLIADYKIRNKVDLGQLRKIILNPNFDTVAKDLVDDQKRTPIHLLAEIDTPDKAKLKDVLELIGLCIKKGVNINAQDNLVNETALFGAYRNKNSIVAELLLSKGANPNIQNVSGDTVFHYACFEGDEEMVKLILKYNPDLMIKNNQCKTGLDYAKEKGHTAIVDLVNEYIKTKSHLKSILGE